jgi:aminoglycoside 3-N-acetyltransferase
MITTAQIRKDLMDMGVHPGSKLIIHSSYKKIGEVEGGPQAFLDTLLDLVGENGVVLMPSFMDLPLPIFDPLTTPSYCGILSETLRKMPGTIRSANPTHSVVVRGHGAQEIADKHETSTALGANSPIHYLIEQGADILLLGVGQTSNSSIHVAEKTLPVPYINVPYNEEMSHPTKRLRSGVVEEVPIDECPGCSENFGIVDAKMQERGAIRIGKIGDAESRLMKGKDLIACCQDMLKEDIHVLLCDDPACSYCPNARSVK